MHVESYRNHGRIGTDSWYNLDAAAFKGTHVFATRKDGTRVHRIVTRLPVLLRITTKTAPVNVALVALIETLIAHMRQHTGR